MNIFYTSLSSEKNSVNAVYIKGFRELGHKVYVFVPEKKGFTVYGDVYAYYKKINVDLIVVGYDSPQLAIFMRIISSKRIVYNALCSVYERIIVSRGLSTRFSIKSFWYWFVDFLAVRCSTLVMLETNYQIEYFKKLFGGSKKYFRAWTGVDDSKFVYEKNPQKSAKFTIIFRGALMPEAGAEYVVQAAKLLEDLPVEIIMISTGILMKKIENLVAELKSKNLIWHKKYLPDEELQNLLHSTHLSLGQLSDHARLTRTIPHKAFESLALGIPYLTASNKGVLELLENNKTCITCEPANAKSLAEKIRWSFEHQKEISEIGENGRQLYLKDLQPKILAEKLLYEIQNKKSF